mgnify:CR=1 FL=1
MTIDLKEDINYIHIDSQKAERYISIRFYSISESEHRYLYAMSSALDFDAENFIYAVPLIPNNIKGGIGIFSIANQVKYKLKEEKLPRQILRRRLQFLSYNKSKLKVLK